MAQLENEKVTVHSTLIRQLLVTERVNDALSLLGHPYELTGRIAKGFGRGQGLGFPTANLTEIETLIPADGVYQATTELDGRVYPVALSIGTLPTFGDYPRQVEAHILDYTSELQSTHLTLKIEKYLRPQIKFSKVADLITKIEEDIKVIRKNQ